MKKFQIMIAICLVLMLVLAFAGCGGSTATPDKSADTSQETKSVETSEEIKANYKIAIVPMALNDPYQVMMSNAAKIRCDELGVEGVIMAPGTGSMADMAGQVELVENLISNGTYSGIVIAPVSKDGIAVCIKKCQDAGLPIVLMDSNADQDALVADGYEKVPYIGTDNSTAAIATGQWIRENYAEGVKLAKINGAEGHDNGDKRKFGLDKGLDGWANIVAEQSTQWAVDDAYKATQNMLAANPDVEVFWCACDALGVGCVRALEEAGVQDKVDVIAYDGTKDGLDLVIAGSEVANTAQFPDNMGKGAVDILIQVLDGEDYELVTDSGYDIIDSIEKAKALNERLSAYL
ncbi:MAG: sugar ABC transporter substrate-binding protein [Christensenellales bacterium]|jgi:ribose transport system substrate-binding protein